VIHWTGYTYSIELTAQPKKKVEYVTISQKVKQGEAVNEQKKEEGRVCVRRYTEDQGVKTSKGQKSKRLIRSRDLMREKINFVILLFVVMLCCRVDRSFPNSFFISIFSSSPVSNP
jgi:hypothetical protein